MHEAERASFDLHRGRPLLVSEPPGAAPAAAVVASAEGLTPSTLDKLRAIAPGVVRLTVARPRLSTTIRGSSGGHGHRQHAMSLPVGGDVGPAELWKLAGGTGSGSVFAQGAQMASAPETAGLTLARWGCLLPAVVGVRIDDPERSPLRPQLESGAILRVTTQQVEAMVRAEHPKLTEVSAGPVPLMGAEYARFMSFREANGMLQHVAVLIGSREQWPDPVPVRIHSACPVGDLFGGLRCDCGDQLRQSLRVFATSGGGVLLYLGQEGWGIGLGNRLRAYSMQHAGLDGRPADCTFGSGGSDRRHKAAVEMLRHLGVTRVQLLTNSPDKVQSVRDGGLRVIDRRPVLGTLNRHNARYIRSKIDRAGHWLGDMLAEPAPSD